MISPHTLGRLSSSPVAHHPAQQIWPSQTLTASTSQVKCVLCKLFLPSEQAFVDHPNLTHGLPGGAKQPSQSFHAPALYHQTPGNEGPGHHTHPQHDQVTKLLAQILPSLSCQSLRPTHPSFPHHSVLPPHQPQLATQQLFSQTNLLGPQLPHQHIFPLPTQLVFMQLHCSHLLTPSVAQIRSSSQALTELLHHRPQFMFYGPMKLLIMCQTRGTTSTMETSQ